MIDRLASTRSAIHWLVSCALCALGCGGSASSICDEICDCEGCSDTERDECIDEIEDAERRAENEGCEEQFDDLVSCIDDELECRDNDLDTDGCEAEAEDLAECTDGSVGFAGGNLCQRAAEICGADPEDAQAQCTEQAECVSRCIIDAGSCDVVENPAVRSCLEGCNI